MGSARLVVAIVVLLLLGGGLWWTASLAPHDSEVVDPWQGTVFVVGLKPEGGGLGMGGLEGNVTSRGTPLAAVEALGDLRGFGVEVEQQSWVGAGCTAAYVVAIAGQRETTTGGWNYYTRHPGGAWTWGSVGAACLPLRQGDQVEWCWVESDACRAFVP